MRELGGWLAEGRLRYRETIIDGLDRAPEALMRVLSGDTTGKALVRVVPSRAGVLAADAAAGVLAQAALRAARVLVLAGVAAGSA